MIQTKNQTINQTTKKILEELVQVLDQTTNQTPEKMQIMEKIAQMFNFCELTFNREKASPKTINFCKMRLKYKQLLYLLGYFEKMKIQINIETNQFEIIRENQNQNLQKEEIFNNFAVLQGQYDMKTLIKQKGAQIIEQICQQELIDEIYKIKFKKANGKQIEEQKQIQLKFFDSGLKEFDVLVNICITAFVFSYFTNTNKFPQIFSSDFLQLILKHEIPPKLLFLFKQEAENNYPEISLLFDLLF